MTYVPRPIDTSGVSLSASQTALLELLAQNTHDVWAARRLADGWRLGPARDDLKKTHPCLVPYEQLPESEKEYDRSVAREVLGAMIRLGWRVEPPAGSGKP